MMKKISGCDDDGDGCGSSSDSGGGCSDVDDENDDGMLYSVFPDFGHGHNN